MALNIKRLIIVLLVIEVYIVFKTNYIDYSKIIYENYNTDSYVVVGEENITSDIANQVTIKSIFDYDDFNYSLECNEDASCEEVEAYKTRYRAAARNYYYQKNRQLLASSKVSGYENIYISKYSPTVEYHFTINGYRNNESQILSKLSKNKNIDKVYISTCNIERKECLEMNLLPVGESQIYKDRTYTGDGVIIGILDLGLVDVDHENFVDTDIETFDQLFCIDTVTDHATIMASIIGGSHGICPDSKLLSAEVQGYMSQEVEWMLDRNVDIINMSYGETNPDGTYGSESAYADFIIKTYDITIVAAVGNNGEGTGYVSNPAMGYNVLSVGMCGATGVRMAMSSYVVDGLCDPKPTIMASGTTVRVNGFSSSYSGTSCSCAIISGSVGILFEKSVSLKIKPDKTLALMTCCSYVDAYALRDNGFSSHEGAGLYNYQNTLSSSLHNSLFTNTSGSAGTNFYDKSVTVNAGETLRVTLATLVNSTGSVDSLAYTDYDLKLLDSNGNLVAIRASGISNIELMEFTAETTGTYRIRVYQHTNRVNSSERVCVSYRIY